MKISMLLRSRRWLTVMLMTLLIFSGLAYKAAAANVILDYTFGTSGIVLNPINSFASDMALQPDGKIVIVGGYQLLRYNSNGILDSAFGSGGIVQVSFPDHPGQYIYSTAVALQPDGKIVVGGFISTGSANTGIDYGLARYNSNGSLDTAFGVGGAVFTSFSNNDDRLEDIALQADGKIVCVGSSYYLNNQPQYELSMIRYNSDGTVDSSFGNSGKVVSSTTYGESVYTVDVQADGKIVASGYIINLNTIFDFLIARYNGNGSVDTSFGNGGATSIDFGTTQDVARQFAFQPDGKIVVTGYPGFCLARLNTDGNLDTSFAVGGKSKTTQGLSDYAYSVKLQPDGKIVLAGISAFLDYTTTQNDFAVMRFNSNGTLDPSFNGNGKLHTDLHYFSGYPTNDNTAEFVIQPDGKIVVSGYSSGFNLGYQYSALAMVRYQSTPRPVAKPYDFDGDGKSDIGVFRPANGSWYVRRSSDGNLVGTQWGASGDLPEPADFDGDSRNDFVLYRNGTWYLLYYADASVAAFQFGTAGDIPVAADYDGDGKADFAVFRPSNGTWYINRSTDNAIQAIQLGTSGDKPVPGDYNGDGKTDVAVWRPSNGTWYTSTNPASNYDAFLWGQNGDIAVPGDYDGDGKNDRAIFRPSTARWWIYYSSNGSYLEQQFGVSTDQPVPADYDGDGKTNIAVFRPSTGKWYTSLDPATNYGEQLWGQSGDVPIETSNVP
ncbi:MAG TPA: FG-GAP-like repeat-containing protein [Pyrinomonadaceae bacterium]